MAAMKSIGKIQTVPVYIPNMDDADCNMKTFYESKTRSGAIYRQTSYLQTTALSLSKTNPEKTKTFTVEPAIPLNCCTVCSEDESKDNPLLFCDICKKSMCKNICSHECIECKKTRCSGCMLPCELDACGNWICSIHLCKRYDCVNEDCKATICCECIKAGAAVDACDGGCGGYWCSRCTPDTSCSSCLREFCEECTSKEMVRCTSCTSGTLCKKCVPIQKNGLCKDCYQSVSKEPFNPNP